MREASTYIPHANFISSFLPLFTLPVRLFIISDLTMYSIFSFFFPLTLRLRCFTLLSSPWPALKVIPWPGTLFRLLDPRLYPVACVCHGQVYVYHSAHSFGLLLIC